MVHKFFDKKSSGSGVNNNEIKQNMQLSNELYKPIIRKLKKRKVYSSFRDNIWSTDLANTQLLSKFNKGFRFLFCVIDTYSKYAWVVLLKDKGGISIVNVFQIILKESNFIIVILKNGYKIILLKCIQHILKENLLLLKDLLKH